MLWAPKYRFKILHGEVSNRMCAIIKQVCAGMGATIGSGVFSRDDVHKFEYIRKRYWCPRL
jgi:putative transposase